MDAPDKYQTTYDSKTKMLVFYSLNLLTFILIALAILGRPEEAVLTLLCGVDVPSLLMVLIL